jgi:hypothetical protein
MGNLPPERAGLSGGGPHPTGLRLGPIPGCSYLLFVGLLGLFSILIRNHDSIADLIADLIACLVLRCSEFLNLHDHGH